MPAAITTLRSTLATDLTNTGVWTTFSFPPATLIPNSVVITPGDPYLVPSNNDYTSIAPLANFKVLICQPALDNQGNLNGLEDFIVANPERDYGDFIADHFPMAQESDGEEGEEEGLEVQHGF